MRGLVRMLFVVLIGGWCLMGCDETGSGDDGHAIESGGGDGDGDGDGEGDGGPRPAADVAPAGDDDDGGAADGDDAGTENDSGVGGKDEDGCPTGEPEYAGDSPHLSIVACRGAHEAIDATLDADSATITCSDDGDTTRMDVEYVGDVSGLLGNLTLKFKDADLAAVTVPGTVDTRVEWEIKSKGDVTLCDQAATTAVLVLHSTVDGSGTGVLGGTLTATMGADDPLADDPCPEALVALSFAALCP